MTEYELIYEALNDAIDSGEIDTEFAEAVNDLAYDKYVNESRAIDRHFHNTYSDHVKKTVDSFAKAKTWDDVKKIHWNYEKTPLPESNPKASYKNSNTAPKIPKLSLKASNTRKKAMNDVKYKYHPELKAKEKKANIAAIGTIAAGTAIGTGVGIAGIALNNKKHRNDIIAKITKDILGTRNENLKKLADVTITKLKAVNKTKEMDKLYEGYLTAKKLLK